MCTYDVFIYNTACVVSEEKQIENLKYWIKNIKIFSCLLCFRQIRIDLFVSVTSLCKYQLPIIGSQEGIQFFIEVRALFFLVFPFFQVSFKWEIVNSSDPPVTTWPPHHFAFQMRSFYFTWRHFSSVVCHHRHLNMLSSIGPIRVKLCRNDVWKVLYKSAYFILIQQKKHGRHGQLLVLIGVYV